MNSPLNILVIDDDEAILGLIKNVLTRNGMIVHTARSTSQADDVLKSFSADLLVLDLMMEGEDGLSYCRRIRQSSNIPIIMLTAIAEDIDRIVGLEVGADDYLGKPFHPRELLARIKTVMRRFRTGNFEKSKQIDKRQFYFGDFCLLPDEMHLKKNDGQSVHLTSGELAVLMALVEHAPRILSRDQLLDLSRGIVANPFDRSIDAQISRLRAKLERDPKKPELIKTVRNMGYALATTVTKPK